MINSSHVDDSSAPASLTAQYTAAHQAALLLDLSDRDEMTLTGSDRVRFLNGFCTQKLVDLQPGESREAFVTNIKGKVLGHILVHIVSDRLIIDTTPAANAVLVPHLDRYLITEDVMIETTTSTRFLFYLTGPAASQLLAEQFSPQVVDLPRLRNANVTWSGQNFFVSRVDWLGETGLLIAGPTDLAAILRALLLTAGAIKGSSAGWNLLRIEAGYPEYGIDFSDQQLAQEIDRTEQAISFSKGCYLGQEPIARIDALGHVNWLVRGFLITEWNGDLSELSGVELFDPIAGGEKSRGKITSVAELPESVLIEGVRLIGMGLIRREQARAGEQFTIRSGQQTGRLIVR